MIQLCIEWATNPTDLSRAFMSMNSVVRLYLQYSGLEQQNIEWVAAAEFNKRGFENLINNRNRQNILCKLFPSENGRRRLWPFWLETDMKETILSFSLLESLHHPPNFHSCSIFRRYIIWTQSYKASTIVNYDPIQFFIQYDSRVLSNDRKWFCKIGYWSHGIRTLGLLLKKLTPLQIIRHFDP